MNPEYQNRLEREIDRQLKGLPELPAPRTLAGRVMNAIEAESQATWHARPWQTWPMALRVASLAGFIALFGALCFLAWAAPRTNVFSMVTSQLNSFFGSFVALHDVVGVLRSAVVVIAKQLGTGVLIGCAAAAAFTYIVCISLGALCVRLAVARR